MELEVQLSQALVSRDPIRFEELLKQKADANKSDGNGITIFEKALATAGCGKFIQLCLQYGCKANYFNKKKGKAAINFASDSRDSENIKILLQQQVDNPSNQLDNKFNELTPLNSLAKNLNAENADEVKKCMSLLLRYGASPNIRDDNDYNPLRYVLYKNNLELNKQREIIDLFLQQHNIEINDELHHELLEWNPKLVFKPNSNINSNSVLCEVESSQMLVECIRSGNHEKFDQLLTDQFDVNGKPQGFDTTYVEIANAYGNWYALEKLLLNKDLKLHSDNNLELLHQTIGRLADEPPLNNFSDYKKCFELLLFSGRVDVNERDKSGRTPLYYAITFNIELCVRELLRHDAYLGIRSHFNELAIDDIDPGLLEEHFNDCITSEGSSRADKNFKIILNYKNLKLPHNTLTKRLSEMEPICAMAKSKDLRYLLTHPLITTLISLKWQSISSLFYLYTGVSALFSIFLVLNILSMFSHDVTPIVASPLMILSWLSIGYITFVDVVIKVYLSGFKRSNIFSLILNVSIIVLSVISNIMSNPEVYYSRVIAAFTILLIAVKLTRLIGSLPICSLSIYVLMLREVSYTFLRSCMPYSILVTCFGLSFYILNFHNLSANSISVAIMRTISMSTGEFNENEIAFKEGSFDRLIFVIFVIYISIVLMNLLSALAFSDTQSIRASAKVNSLTNIVNLLSCYEVHLTKSWGKLGKVASLPESVFIYPNKKQTRTETRNSCVEEPLINTTTTRIELKSRRDHQNNINIPEDHFIMQPSKKTTLSYLQLIDRKSKITIARKLENIEQILSEIVKNKNKIF